MPDPIPNPDLYVEQIVAAFDPEQFDKVRIQDRSGFLQTLQSATLSNGEGVTIGGPQTNKKLLALGLASFQTMRGESEQLDPLLHLIETLHKHFLDPSDYSTGEVLPASVRAASQTITTCQLYLIGVLDSQT